MTKRNRAWAIGVMVALSLGLSTSALAEDPPPADDAPEKPWEFKVAAGLALRDGDQSRFTGNADLLYQYAFTQDTWTLRGLAFYGESDGDRDTENYFGNLAWKHAFTDRFFWLTNAGVDSDQIQGRNIRFAGNSGPGYRIWQGEEDEYFDIASGIGYRHERLREDGGGRVKNDLVDAVASYHFQNTFGEALEIIHNTDLYAPVNDIEDFLARSELTLSVPIFSGLHFRNNARYEYVNDPADGRNSSNFWLTIGLEYRL